MVLDKGDHFLVLFREDLPCWSRQKEWRLHAHLLSSMEHLHTASLCNQETWACSHRFRSGEVPAQVLMGRGGPTEEMVSEIQICFLLPLDSHVFRADTKTKVSWWSVDQMALTLPNAHLKPVSLRWLFCYYVNKQLHDFKRLFWVQPCIVCKSGCC